METLLFPLLLVFIQIILLSGLVLTAIWFYFRIKRKQLLVPSSTQSPDEYKRIYLTTKLQACERLILFLERISPPNLILRVHTSEMTSIQLQTALIRTIREEFEYNLSQQLYVSVRTWELISHAKEETIRLIHAAASNMTAGCTSRELASEILQLSLDQQSSPISIAIESIREEVR